MRFWAPVALVLGWMIGCDDGSRFLAIPNVDGAQSFVLGIDDSSGQKVEAGRVGEAALQRFRDGQAYFATYDRSLETLQLASGSVSAQPGAPCERLRPTQMLEAVVSDKPRWSVSELPDWMADALVPDRQPRCEPCLDLEITMVVPPDLDPSMDSGDVQSFAWLESGRLLVTMGYDRALIATPAGAELVEDCGDLGGILQLLPLGGDRFWGATRGEELVQFRIDEALGRCMIEARLTVPVTLPDTDLRWIAGPGARDADGEVFVLSGLGELLRFDGVAFESLTSVPLPPPTVGASVGTSDGGLVWLGPGQVAFNVGTDIVYFWEQGRLREEKLELSINAGGRLIELDEIPGFGLVVGAANGQVYRRVARGDWERLIGQPEGTSTAVGGIARLGTDRLVMVGEGGWVSQYSESLGFCEQPIFITGTEENGSKALGSVDGVVIADFLREHAGSPEPIVWLRPR